MSEFDSIIISGSAIKEINGLYHHHHMEGRSFMKNKVMTPNVYTHEKHENIHIKDTGFGFHEIIKHGRLFGYIIMSPNCNSLHECSTNPERPKFCYAFTAITIDIESDTSPWHEFRDEGGKPFFVNKMTNEKTEQIPDTTFHPYVNAERDTNPAGASGVYVLKYDPALKISPAHVWAGGAGYKKKYKSKSRNLRSQKHRNKKTRSKRRRVKSRRY